MSVWLIFLN